MSKNSGFRRPFNKQYGKRDQTLLKSEQQHLYHIHWSPWIQLSWKKSLIVICKILGLFLNTLTLRHKYFLLNRDKLKQSIQMQLSLTKKPFSNFFCVFEIKIKRLTLSKKRRFSSLIYFPKLCTPKNVVK